MIDALFTLVDFVNVRRRCRCRGLRPPEGEGDVFGLSYSGNAVVFFTVRSTSSEFDRTTPGRRASTSE